MKKIKLILIILFSFLSITFADNKKEDLYGGKFTRIVGEINSKAKIDWEKFYPLNIEDFWEFIEKDTTTLFGFFSITYRLNFSIAKEIISDTLMPNGLIYKKIKIWNCANSVNREIKYSFQRADSLGKIYTYLNNSNKLLYDLTKNKNETYPSPFENFFWKVLDKYYVVGFGNTLLAIDIALFDSNNVIKYRETIIENFGVVFYQGNLKDDYRNPEGRFWGAVIKGNIFGDLIALKQRVDWKEFYPLHVGNFWKYSSRSGSIHSIITSKIIGDTIMPDFNIYSIYRTINYTFEDTSYGYMRVDSLGNIYFWEGWSSSSRRSIRFNNIVGDTIGVQGSSTFYWRINNKSDSSIKFFLYPDLIYAGNWYTKGLGLTEWTIEGGGGYLVGAIINGRVYGDTTITNIEDKQINFANNFKLYQNYPNPFNPTTTIKYTTFKNSFVTLKVYDLLGREVRTLINEPKQAGEYEVEFNADKYGLSSGVYLYQLTAGSFTSAKKFVYLR